MQKDQVIQAMAAILQDNIGNRLTLAMANGIVVEMQRLLAEDVGKPDSEKKAKAG